jgi:hypothetical protein
MPLPQLEDLSAYITGPLTEDDKIRISPEEFNRLASHADPRSYCSPEDLQRLFKPGANDRAEYMLSNIVYRALNFAPPDGDSTESSFHSFWDDNIRWILESVFTASRTIRYSNMHTSTGLLRPDFGLLLRGNCAFRGEEKAPGFTGRHPKDELIEKLRWTYYPALYILGL